MCMGMSNLLHLSILMYCYMCCYGYYDVMCVAKPIV